MSKPLQMRCAQRGVAVVTALLLTTLAVTIVASLFWQQQVQVRSIENQRLQLQKDWIMRGALDWASMILRASARQFNYDHLGQPWATPLADTRLDQYAEDGKSASDAGDAILSGSIIDAQSRYNLNNLSLNGNPVADEVAGFKRLLGFLRLPTSLATAAAQAIADGQPTTASTTASTGPQTVAKPGSGTLPMLQVNDLLAVPGFTPDIVRKLQDYVVVLPPDASATPINANTASAEVLAACFDNLSLAEANTVVEMRRTAPFRDNVQGRMGERLNKAFSPTAKIGPASNFFLVYGKIRMGRAALNTVSLIRRPANNRAGSEIVWIREQ
ncbi:type II secretion system minor pseudopilin GspK [Collimonas antrihumi]|uniref:type II secretion system minor pseudopilin GspK n=1 Tax=Collimonas antrihumi TaxID=1940615 RepID=UPI001FEC31C1|nr:type II secretion system minor pseudopilin GspK [Collimonas antrihumi]